LKAALQTMSCRNGTPLAADPQAFAAGARAASQDDCFNFEGTSGQLTFDARNEAPGSYGLWCAGRAEFRPLQGRASTDMYFDSAGNLFGLEDDEPLPFCSATE
jgi:hypothetical protein